MKRNLKSFRIKNDKKFKKIVVTDWSSYEDGKQNTGGGYLYKTKYIKTSNPNKFEVEYWTSADFDYCPYCGTFHEDYWNCETEYISRDELAAEIDKISDDEDLSIEFFN